MMKLTALACGLVALSGAAAQEAVPLAADCEFKDALMTISQKAKTTTEISTFITNVEEIDALKTIVQDKTAAYTVFAPSNTAFTNADLSEVADELLKAYQTHLVLGANSKAELIELAASADPTLMSVEGTKLIVANVDGTITITDTSDPPVVAEVTDQNDLDACNSVIHVIDSVLPVVECSSVLEAAKAANLVTLASAVEGTDATYEAALKDKTTEWTVFAPSEEAFAALTPKIEADTPQATIDAILKAHIVKMAPIPLKTEAGAVNKVTTDDGRDLFLVQTTTGTTTTITINDAAGTAGKKLATASPGVDACGSVIYVIDTVIPTLPCLSITAVATADEDLAVFVETLKESKYDESAADTASELTVFAPTDAAFEVEAVVALISDADQASKDAILGTHIIEGAMMAADLKTGKNLTTITGQQLLVTKTATAVTLTDFNGNVATVKGADMKACGSVVHKIDNVLTPNPDVEVSAAFSTKAGLGVVAFVAALFFM